MWFENKHLKRKNVVKNTLKKNLIKLKKKFFKNILSFFKRFPILKFINQALKQCQSSKLINKIKKWNKWNFGEVLPPLEKFCPFSEMT